MSIGALRWRDSNPRARPLAGTTRVVALSSHLFASPNDAAAYTCHLLGGSVCRCCARHALERWDGRPSTHAKETGASRAKQNRFRARRLAVVQAYTIDYGCSTSDRSFSSTSLMSSPMPSPSHVRRQDRHSTDAVPIMSSGSYVARSGQSRVEPSASTQVRDSQAGHGTAYWNGRIGFSSWVICCLHRSSSRIAHAGFASSGRFADHASSASASRDGGRLIPTLRHHAWIATRMMPAW